MSHSILQAGSDEYDLAQYGRSDEDVMGRRSLQLEGAFKPELTKTLFSSVCVEGGRWNWASQERKEQSNNDGGLDAI